MLRIHFSRDDVARTRVAPGADPVWELILSLHFFQARRPQRDPLLAGWRREVAAGLRHSGDGESVRLLFALNPPQGYFPDFLTPFESRAGLLPGLDAIRSTPTANLRRDLTLLAAGNRLPASASALARGDSGDAASVDRVDGGLPGAGHRSLLEPDRERGRGRSRSAGSGHAGRRRGRAVGQPPAGDALGRAGAGGAALSGQPGPLPRRPRVAAGAGVLLRAYPGHARRPRPAAGAGLPGRAARRAGPAGRAGPVPPGRAARPHPGPGARGGRRRLLDRRDRPPARHLGGRRQPAHRRAAQRQPAGQPPRRQHHAAHPDPAWAGRCWISRARGRCGGPRR